MHDPVRAALDEAVGRHDAKRGDEQGLKERTRHAIRRAGSDKPEAIQAALKTTTMPSRLGGSYVPDDHNHAHTPLQILGLRDGKPAVIAIE